MGATAIWGTRGRDHMLSLLKERFWWLGMAQRMMMSVCNCSKMPYLRSQAPDTPDGAYPVH